MAPKKKASTNGFMEFMFEWKGKYGQRMSIGDATHAAGKIWAEMGPEERAPYNARAKQSKFVSANEDKLTCTGQSFKMVEKQKNDAEQRERQIKRNIESTVQNSLKNNELDTQSYFFIMVNYFTKNLKNGFYIPAEISLSEYSLKNGVQRVYHTFVNPVVQIYGHTYDAKHYSETTHMLPVPPKAMGESNLPRIFDDILEFVRCKETGQYAPVYTNRDCIQIVESVFFFLKTDSETKNIELDVYPIQYLFYILKEATCEVGEVEKPKSAYITDAFFERDHFEYTVGCKYHDDLDRNRYCTKSFVTRWGYIFSDYMCADLAISLIPERHAPKGTNFTASAPSFSSCNDTDSTISMMTNTTYDTKALSEHKIYRDDQTSVISEQTSSHTWHTAKQAATSEFRSGDFPALSSAYPNRRKAANTPTEHNKNAKIANAINSYMDNDNDLDDDLNPWSKRKNKLAPKPTDTSFFSVDLRGEKTASNSEFDELSLMWGIGRGRKLDSSVNTTGSSAGRGKLNFK